MDGQNEESLEKVLYILEKNSGEMTIINLVNKTKISRSLIRTILANLEGADKVKFKKIGVAKVYSLR